MMSRRDLGKLALGAVSAPAMAAQKIDSVVHGIQFGLPELHIHGDRVAAN